MGKPALVVKIRRTNFFQIIPVTNHGAGPIHVRHIGFAVFHCLSDGLRLDIVNVIVENRNIDAVFILNLQCSGDQHVRICIKLFGSRPDFLHRKFVHLGANGHPVRNPVHGGFKSSSPVLKC